MDTAAQFAAKAAAMPTRLQANLRRGVGDASLAVKRSVEHELGTSRLRGVGRGGAAVGVRYRISTTSGAPSSLVTATGPVHLLERDTAPHDIEPKPRRRRSGRTGIATAYGVFARVRHPGTRGKHPFENGVRAAVPEAHRALAGSFRSTMREVFS